MNNKARAAGILERHAKAEIARARNKRDAIKAAYACFDVSVFRYVVGVLDNLAKARGGQA